MVISRCSREPGVVRLPGTIRLLAALLFAVMAVACTRELAPDSIFPDDSSGPVDVASNTSDTAGRSAPDTSPQDATPPCVKADCDDGNPCTADDCGVDNSCKHTTAANGFDCSAGDPCTTSNVCESGVCTAGTPKLFVRPVGEKGLTEYFANVKVLPGGDYLTCGRQGWPEGAWIARWNAQGKAVWKRHYKSATTAENGRAIALMADATAVIVGNNKTSALLLHHTVDGKLLASKTYKPSDGTAEFYDCAVAGSKEVFAVGVVEAKTDYAWMMRVAANGQVAWQQRLSSSKDDDRIRGVVRLASGDVFAVGYGHPVGKKDIAATAYRVRPGGQSKWRKRYVSAANSWYDVDLSKKGQLVAVGARAPGDGPKAGAWGLDEHGRVLWETPVGSLDSAMLNEVLALADGNFAATGGSQPVDGKERQPFVARFAAGGRLLSARHVLEAGLTKGWGWGLDAHVDATLVIAGSAVFKGGGDGMMARVDAWGHSDCATTGVCFSRKAGSCDDGKPCTHNRCSGGSCTHPPRQEGDACVAGSACQGHGLCKGGSCDGAADRMHTRNFGAAEGAAFYGLAAAPGSGAIAVGVVDSDSAADGFVAVQDRRGKAIWSWQSKHPGGDQLQDIAWTRDGRFVACGSATVGKDMRGWLVDGAIGVSPAQWTATIPASRFDACAALAAGGVIAIGSAAGQGGGQNTQAPLAVHRLGTGAAWSVVLPASVSTTGWDVVARHDDAVWVGIARSEAAGSERTVVGAINASGNPTWFHTLPSKQAETGRAIAAVSNGRLIVAGAVVDGVSKAIRGQLIGLSALGDVTWRKQVAPGSALRLVCIAAAQDGTWWATGQRLDTGGARLFRVDGAGFVVADASPKATEISTVAAAAVDDSARIMVAGQRGTKPTAAVIRTLGPFGFPSCKAAGTCAPANITSCSDANPCTADHCVASKGCSHPALPDGSPCGATKACAAGSCVSSLGTKAQPAVSCKALADAGVGDGVGEFWIDPDGTGPLKPKSVTCDLDTDGGGWTRVHKMLEHYKSWCMGSWQIIWLQNSKTGTKHPACGISGKKGCSPKSFSNHGVPYSEVRGSIVGMMGGAPDGFGPTGDIDNVYVDGISITAGKPRVHIWTYAMGATQSGSYSSSNCPCAAKKGPSPPSFVGDHWSCDAAWKTKPSSGWALFPTLFNTPANCDTANTCCARPGMPTFQRSLGKTINEPITVRLCADNGERIAMRQLEIWVR